MIGPTIRYGISPANQEIDISYFWRSCPSCFVRVHHSYCQYDVIDRCITTKGENETK